MRDNVGRHAYIIDLIVDPHILMTNKEISITLIHDNEIRITWINAKDRINIPRIHEQQRNQNLFFKFEFISLAINIILYQMLFLHALMFPILDNALWIK